MHPKLQCASRGDKLWRAKPSLPDSVPEDARDSGNLSTVSYLKSAALQMLKQGCGEGWLLQPKILDMPDLEYRWRLQHHEMPETLGYTLVHATSMFGLAASTNTSASCKLHS